MPKTKQTSADFALRVEQIYPGVFIRYGSEMKCIVCNSVINGLKLFRIRQHVEIKKHVEARVAMEEQNNTIVLREESQGSLPLGKKLREIFLKANIPLKKISHPAVRDFLQEYVPSGELVPSESTLRQKYVPQLYWEKIEELRAKSDGNYIWASIDETTDSEQRQVVNFVFGLLDDDTSEKGKAYLFNMSIVQSANAQTMSRFLNDSFAFLWPKGIQYDKVLLIVTEAAPYMCAAMNSIKALYPKMLHITCFSHGLHRLAEFIRSEFINVNELISENKAIFVKTPSRRNAFQTMAPNIALPPTPCITRWTTWLKSVIYYCDKFEIVKQVVDTFDDEDADAIRRAKRLFKDDKIKTDLAFIKCNFTAVVNATIKFETQDLEFNDSITTLEEIRNALKGMQRKGFRNKFEKIPDRNKGYKSLLEIYEVLYKGSVSTEEYVKNLSPTEINMFKYCPISSADVERSFSAYSSVLTEKRRSFSFENLKHHMIVYCNQKKYD